MNTLLKSLILVVFAAPAFGQNYGYPYYPYYPGYAQPMYIPPMHVVNPDGYRPTYLHSLMNPYYAQQFALDLSYQMNWERKQQFMEQAARQREALLYLAQERREQIRQKRMASQQRSQTIPGGKPVLNMRPAIDPVADDADEPIDDDRSQLNFRDF